MIARGPRTGAWLSVPRQDGRTFVVTGATSGIGLQTARILAGFGAHVVLAVRNTEKGEAVARDLTGSVEVRRLDVADLSSVRGFAADLGEVDVLVNNAGVMALPFARSVDGFETQIATNHLGHFALANLLLPRLADRVVVVGSASHWAGELDVDDLDWDRRGYQPYAAYAQSKLANLLFLAELQRRLTAAGSTLRATGAHPGYTSTGIQLGTGNRAFTWLSNLGNALVGMPAVAGRAARRCTPPRWTCPATPTSARPARGRCWVGRAWSAAAPPPAIPISPAPCGSGRSSSRGRRSPSRWSSSERQGACRDRSVDGDGLDLDVLLRRAVGGAAARTGRDALLGDALDDLDARVVDRPEHGVRRRQLGVAVHDEEL